MLRRRIKKIHQVSFLSLVPRGANNLCVIYKEDAKDNEDNLELKLLSKASSTFDERGEIYAVAYPAERRDNQGDIASADVCREMCHKFAKEGMKLDLRHDNKPVARDRAYVVENFLIQKADPRFADWKDYQGKPVDVTGSWGVVLKVDCPELRKLYREGKWGGVSLEGRAEFEIEKSDPDQGDDSVLTKEEVEKIIKSALSETSATLLKSVDEKIAGALKKSDEEAAKKKQDEDKVVKIDLTDKKAVAARLQQLKKEQLAKEVDINDPEALAAHLALLQKQEEEALSKETPEQKVARLTKEVAARDAKIAKLQKASTLPPTGEADTSSDDSADVGDLSKEEQDAFEQGKKEAEMINASRGFKTDKK